MQTDNTLKYIIYTLLGAIFLVPFVVDSSQLFPFITGKAFLFRILAESIFFVWLILAIRNPQYRPRLSLIMASVTAFVVMLGISNVFGANPFFSFWSNYERMEGYVNILHLFAMFLAIGATIKTREDWNKIILTSFVISIGMLYNSFQQHFGYKEISQGGRLDATFGNPIYLAVYNLFHIFFGLYLIVTKDFIKENWQKIFAGIVVALHLFVLYQTNTRGAVLGLIGGLFLTGLINIFTTKTENKKIWLSSLAGVILILVMIAGFISIKDSDFVQNNKVLNRFAEISLTSGTSEARLLNWSIAYEGFKEKPILGWGMGNYSYVFDKHYKPEMYGNEVWFDHVHNIVLDWLIAGGLIGLLLYILVLKSLSWAILRNKNYSHLERNIFLGLVTAYFIQNIFVFDNQTSYIYFFLLLAMFHSQKNREISVFKYRVNKNLSQALITIVVILIPFSIYAVNVSSYFASVQTIDTLRKMSGLQKITPENGPKYIKEIIKGIEKTAKYNSPASLEIRTKGIVEPAFVLLSLPELYLSNQDKQNLLQFAFEQMNQELRTNSNDAKTNYVMGIYLSQVGDLQGANKFLEKSVELSPQKHALIFALAFNYLRMGDNEKAISLAKQSYESVGEDKIISKYDLLWVDYARVISIANPELSEQIVNDEIKEGRSNRVELFLKKIIELNPDSHQNYFSLAAFYFQIDQKEKTLEVLEDLKIKFPDLVKQIDKVISEIKAGKNPLGNKF